jgi:hypothetical protein
MRTQHSERFSREKRDLPVVIRPVAVEAISLYAPAGAAADRRGFGGGMRTSWQTAPAEKIVARGNKEAFNRDVHLRLKSKASRGTHDKAGKLKRVGTKKAAG